MTLAKDIWNQLAELWVPKTIILHTCGIDLGITGWYGNVMQKNATVETGTVTTSTTGDGLPKLEFHMRINEFKQALINAGALQTSPKPNA